MYCFDSGLGHMLCLHDIDNYMGPPCSNAAVLLFRKTAKQARLVLPQHLPQHLPLNVMRISALTRSLQLIQSTSSLLSRMQLFQRSPSAVVNHLRLGYHIQTPCLPAALSLHRQHASTILQGCLPACTSVYQPAPVSTNLQGRPPTCMGVHQPAKQDGYMAIYGQLDSRCTDRPQAQTEQTCSVYLNTQEEDAAVILQRSKAPAKTKLLCRLMTKVTIPACIPLYQLPRAAQFGLFFVQPRSGSSKSLVT